MFYHFLTPDIKQKYNYFCFNNCCASYHWSFINKSYENFHRKYSLLKKYGIARCVHVFITAEVTLETLTPMETTLDALTEKRTPTTDVRQTLLNSTAELSTEVEQKLSTHSFLTTTLATSVSTTAIFIGVIVVMFVAMVLGALTCLCIILIIRRSKSEKKNMGRTERKVNTSIAETNVNREYESIEDYINTSSIPTRCHEKDISFTPNRAYASIKH